MIMSNILAERSRLNNVFQAYAVNVIQGVSKFSNQFENNSQLKKCKIFGQRTHFLR